MLQHKVQNVAFNRYCWTELTHIASLKLRIRTAAKKLAHLLWLSTPIPKVYSPPIARKCIENSADGDLGYSAMAKLVGVPCAVAVLKVLDGTIKEKGILAPMTPELNNPM